MIKPVKRCWNCRDAKRACDKGFPSCTNCRRKKVVCAGYGLRLSWPPEINERRNRRSAAVGQHYVVGARSTDFEFVNVSQRDIEELDGYERQLPILRGLGQVSVRLGIFDPITSANGYNPESTLVSCNTCSSGGLHGLLTRLSCSNETLPSHAVRFALSALFFQQCGKARPAIEQHMKALRALQMAIDSPLEPSQALQAMAASRLLNIFETQNASSSPEAWAVLFCGTKKLAEIVHKSPQFANPDYLLSQNWTYYHDSMYKFSIRHWNYGQVQQIPVVQKMKMISRVVHTPKPEFIAPCLGYCTSEVFMVLGLLTDAVCDQDSPDCFSNSRVNTIERLQTYLQNLTGLLTTSNQKRPSNAAIIAELFRLAALVYLHRVIKAEPRHSAMVLELLYQSYELVNSLEACVAPWPLFVIGIEAVTDEERKLILSLIARSAKQRPVGPIGQIKYMVTSSWIQQDFSGNMEIDALSVYNAVISKNSVPPPFT